MIVQFAATCGDFVGRTAIAAKQLGHQGCETGIDRRKAVVQAMGFFRSDMGVRQPMQRFFLCSGVRRTNHAKRMHTHAVCAEKPVTNNTGLNQRRHKGADWMQRTELRLDVAALFRNSKHQPNRATVISELHSFELTFPAPVVELRGAGISSFTLTVRPAAITG